MKKTKQGIVSITDYSEDVENDIIKALKRALMAVGLQVERNAKEELSVPKPHGDGTVRPNVVTGNLRNSITHSYNLSDMAVYVGTNVKYAPYVELGTSRARAYPYLRPGVENHMHEYQTIIKDELTI